MTERRLLISIITLSLLGAAISIYSFAHHFLFASGSFCNLSEAFSCDVVNRGPYSVIFGVPVSLIGVVGYLLLAAAAFVRIKQPHDRNLLWFLLLAAIGGLGFSFYLTSIEAFILHTWCLLCVTSQILMLLLFISIVWLWFSQKKYAQNKTI